MQFITVALSLFVAVAAAQTNSTSDSLPDLIAQLPTCALDCFDLAATSADCTTTDFDCICSKKEFVTSIGACVLLGNSCSQEDISSKFLPRIIHLTHPQSFPALPGAAG